MVGRTSLLSETQLPSIRYGVQTLKHESPCRRSDVDSKNEKAVELTFQ